MRTHPSFRSSISRFSIASLGILALGHPPTPQGLPRKPDVPAESLPSRVDALLTIVLEGVVLGPDGAPVRGAVVSSSAGGRTPTGSDGRYRLEVQVPLDVASVQLTALADDGGVVSTSAALGTGGLTPVAPLVFAPGRECEPRWLPTFGGEPGADGILAFTVFDDGTGAALYTGGSFIAAGGAAAAKIAKWDGTRWTAVGFGVPISAITSLATHDDGNGPALYAAARRTNGPGSIWRWDGAAWSSVATLDTFGVVHSLAVFDDGNGAALHAGGAFSSVNGMPATGIVKWDGTSWTSLGSEVNTYALAVFDDGQQEALYAGVHDGVRKWDGVNWSVLGGSTNERVRALTVFDDGNGPALYAGGDFSSAGGVPANHIARWNGTSWSALGSGMNGPVNALAVFDDGHGPVLVSGSSGAPQYIAMWNGVSWSPMNGGMDATVRALATFDDGSGPALFAGGDFTRAGGLDVVGFARWDGSSWRQRGKGLNGAVEALAVFDDGSGPALHAGGEFTSANGVEIRWIGKWDGTRWSPLGAGMDDPVRALAVFDDGTGPALYAGGDFVLAGGVPANRIARWDGSGWSPLGSGMSGPVRVLAVFDDGTGPALYAGGDFTLAGGTISRHVAKWDGSSWSALGTGTGDSVLALAAFDDGTGLALYAGGTFGGRIARWNGTSWSALGGSFLTCYPQSSSVEALATFDDGGGTALYVGGEFTQVGGVQVGGIVRWNGSSWSAVGNATPFASCPVVDALAVHDDGGGPALYVGGRFDLTGISAGFAKWDGSRWSPLGSGFGPFRPRIGDFAAFDAGDGRALYAGGSFATLPDSGDSYLARWGQPKPCLPAAKARKP